MWIIGVLALAGALGAAIAATPRRVRYTESIEIDAPAADLYDHIRFQRRLMLWSAWPTETGSDCACEDPDGALGARTLFLKSGKPFGHQEVTALDPQRSVELSLRSKGPPQRPRVTFALEPLSPQRTRVLLHFDNSITPPFNLLMRVAGIVRWTRDMHRKDLAGLKRYAEPPHRTYAGDPATIPAAP